MKPSHGEATNRVDVRVKSRNEHRVLVPEAEPPSITFTPHPEAPSDHQRGVEQAAGDPHLHGGGGVGIGEAAGDGGEGEFGDGESGDRVGVEADLLDAAAELAGAASAPREELQISGGGDGGGGGFGFVQDWDLAGRRGEAAEERHCFGWGFRPNGF